MRTSVSLSDLEQPGPPLKTRDVAVLLGVSVGYVRDLVAAGALRASKLPSVGPGGPRYGRLRIRREDVLQLAREINLLPQSSQSPQSTGAVGSASPRLKARGAA
jgi:excisionase family DNA binding protein